MDATLVPKDKGFDIEKEDFTSDFGGNCRNMALHGSRTQFMSLQDLVSGVEASRLVASTLSRPHATASHTSN
jgi:hypothetical protein